MTAETPVPARDESDSKAEAHQATLSDGRTMKVVLDGPGASDAAEKAWHAAALELEAALSDEGPAPLNYGGVIGESESMRSLFRMLARIEKSDATILVLGDNGTGKELVARAIHRNSKRASKSFVAANCSAFNDNLLESELFGHRRGSFTGAVADKPGLFSVADRGTFFMDEVGDMSAALQVKLLRVLQEGVFMPVGATEPQRVDVRIIAATNRDLAEMVKAGTFREDLYYRLHVVSLRVPPLRERADDIPILVKYFLKQLSKRTGDQRTITDDALQALMGHKWPGNVRELENEMERAWVLCGEQRVIDRAILSPAVARKDPNANPPLPLSTSTGGTAMPPAGTTLPAAIEALERKMIEAELAQSGGNKTRAAEALGISRRNLIRKVQGYALGDTEES